nr:MCP four helix bundle domain-containing protein [Roseateles albus]
MLQSYPITASELPKTKKISTRLLILVGTPCALLVTIGALGLYGLEKTNASLKTVYEDRAVPAVELGQINALISSSRLHDAQALVNTLPDVAAFSIKPIPTGSMRAKALIPGATDRSGVGR